MIDRDLFVTAHAVVRWIERAAGVDTTEIRRDLAQRGIEASDHMLLCALRDMHPGAVADAMHALGHPTVRAAARLGARGIKIGTVRVIIVGGALVTVEHVWMRRHQMRRSAEAKADRRRSAHADRRARSAIDEMEDVT